MDQHRTGTREGPPKVLGLIPLSPSANLDAVREGLLANAGAENTPVRTATQTFLWVLQPLPSSLLVTHSSLRVRIFSECVFACVYIRGFRAV